MRRRHVPLGALLAFALGLSACSADAPPLVETALVTSGEVVQTVAAPGELEPQGRQVVVAPAPAEVSSLLVADGDTVELGQPIAVLTSDTVGLAVAQASAAVTAVRALGAVSLTPDLSPAVATLRFQYEETVSPILETLQAQAEAIEDEEARTQALAAVDYLRRQYTDARNALLGAEAAAKNATQESNASQREAVLAQRRAAEIALDAAREQEAGLTMTAPAAGIIEFARGSSGELGTLFGTAPVGEVVEGSVVAPGQPMFTIYDLSDFHVTATVDEVDAVLVTEGQAVTVLIDAYPTREFEAVVFHVAVAPDRSPTGGTVYPVEVRFNALPKDVKLRVGLTASAEIVVASISSDTIVPASALRRIDGQEVVPVVRDGLVVHVPVQVDVYGPGSVAVSGDLREGERVITVGADTLQPGDEVPAS